jgi:LysR family glycine cleavage system transcriptional activator
MSRSQLPLTALRAFEATARHLSFTKAADELSVTQGAVSQQVSLLEKRVGAPLFVRNGHRISLTRDGEVLLGATTEAFDGLDIAIQSMARRPGPNVLKIKLFPTSAIRWVVPRLSSFHAEHPRLDVQITTSLKVVDFRTEDVDVSLRYGAGNWPGIQSDHLFSEVLAPVCSPGFRKAHKLTKVSDLARLPVLHSLQRGNDWPMWLNAAGHGSMRLLSNLRFGNSSLAYQAALDGAGVALAVIPWITDYLREGKLALAFPAINLPDRGYYLVCDSRRANLARIADFRRWILRQSEIARKEVEQLNIPAFD